MRLFGLATNLQHFGTGFVLPFIHNDVWESLGLVAYSEISNPESNETALELMFSDWLMFVGPRVRIHPEKIWIWQNLKAELHVWVKPHTKDDDDCSNRGRKACFFLVKNCFRFTVLLLSLFLFIVQNVTALEEENSLLKENIRSFEESSVSFDWGWAQSLIC